MTKHDVKAELERVASGPDFLSRVADMTSEWSSQLLGLGAVRAVLEFMEQRPDLYFGSPGPLVHFVERFYGKGYEKELLASIQRKPTVHTVWMLNRVINGVRSAGERRRLIDTLDATRHHPLADRGTIEEAEDFYRSHLFR
jgi:hypothetical protein